MPQALNSFWSSFLIWCSVKQFLMTDTRPSHVHLMQNLGSSTRLDDAKRSGPKF